MGTTLGARTRYRQGREWPRRCCGAGKYQHAKGCWPARPVCRWRRKQLARKYGLPCECDAYHFPHRKRSGLCGLSARERYERETGRSWDDGRKLDDARVSSYEKKRRVA